MKTRSKSSGLLARIDAEILHAVGLGALIATVGMGISLVAGTAAIATTTALIAMSVGAAIGIGAMVGSVLLGRKAEEAKPHSSTVVVIQAQAQGLAHGKEPEVSTLLDKGKFTRMIEAERAKAVELSR
jgi:hypothetical protein